MRFLSSWTNRFLIAVILLGLVTSGIGVAACPMRSLPMQFVFLVLSSVTLAWSIIALFLTPFPRAQIIGIGIGPFGLLWIGLLLSYYSPKVREASGRTVMGFNGKNIGIAAHDHHDVNRRLPQDYRTDAGDPLLSWRVSILPYIDQQPLFARFERNSAWDSPRNQPLQDPMPYVYQSIMFQQAPTQTPWQGFIGPGTVFEPSRDGLRLATDFPDGTSFTIFCIEASQHTPWTKPGDITYGPNIPLPVLGEHYPGAPVWPFCCPVDVGRNMFLVCMTDATVRMFRADIPEETMRALIVRNDGKPGRGWEFDN